MCLLGWQCKQTWDTFGSCANFVRPWPQHIQSIHLFWWWMVYGWYESSNTILAFMDIANSCLFGVCEIVDTTECALLYTPKPSFWYDAIHTFRHYFTHLRVTTFIFDFVQYFMSLISKGTKSQTVKLLMT